MLRTVKLIIRKPYHYYYQLLSVNVQLCSCGAGYHDPYLLQVVTLTIVETYPSLHWNVTLVPSLVLE